MEYDQHTVNDLRSLARERGVEWRDDDGRPLRKGELIERLEGRDAEAMDAEEPAASPEPGEPGAAAAELEDDRAALEGGEDGSEGEADAEAPAEAPEAAAAPLAAPETAEAPEGEPPEPERFYRVAKDARVILGGLATRLPAGQVISSITHDIPRLTVQGVELEPADGRDPLPRDSYGEPVVAYAAPWGRPSTAVEDAPSRRAWMRVPDPTRDPNDPRGEREMLKPVDRPEPEAPPAVGTARVTEE
jgi:hypothetical protein